MQPQNCLPAFFPLLAVRNTIGLPQSGQGKDRAEPIPACPDCGKPMVLRTASKGKNAGKQFWGCTAYPDCKGIVDL